MNTNTVIPLPWQVLLAFSCMVRVGCVVTFGPTPAGKGKQVGALDHEPGELLHS